MRRYNVNNMMKCETTMNAHANDNRAHTFTIATNNAHIVFACDDDNERIMLRATNDDERETFMRAHAFARHAMFHTTYDDDARTLTFIAYDDENDAQSLLREMIVARREYDDAKCARVTRDDDARDEMMMCRDAFARVLHRMCREYVARNTQ